MEEDDEDPYASILEVCNPTQRQPCDALRLTRDQIPFDFVIPLPNPLSMLHFVDHSQDADGSIIPPQSIQDYLCPTPETSHHHHHDDVDVDVDDNDNDHHHHNYNNDDYYVEALGQDHTTPPCVVSYQILSPPSMESPLASPDCDEISSVDQDQHLGDSLWLSQLKSMARQEGLFELAVSVVTQFRASQYRLSLSPLPSDSTNKRRLGSSSKSRKREQHPLKRPKREFSDTVEVVRSRSSSSEKKGGLLGTSSKSKGNNVSKECRLKKKQKQCENNLDLESSKCEIGSLSDESEKVNVVVVSDSEEAAEDHFGFVSFGGDTLEGGVSFKEPGGLSAADVASTYSNTKNKGSLDKSKGVCSDVGVNPSDAGQHHLPDSTSKTIDAAKSKAVGSSRLRSENPSMKHVFDTLKIGVNEKHGGSSGRSLGLANGSALDRVPLKECQIGVVIANESHNNAAGNSLGSENTRELQKPIGDRGTGGTNR